MQGELDLQNLTPREEAIFLNGNWEFYPEKFLLQEDEFQSSQKDFYLFLETGMKSSETVVGLAHLD